MPKLAKILILSLLSVFVAAAPSWAAAPGQLDLGSIMTSFQSAASSFGTAINEHAAHLLYALLAIEFAVHGNKRMLQGGDLIEFVGFLVSRIIFAAVLVWLINDSSVIKTAINGFIQLGQQGANVSALYPTDIFTQGIDLILAINSKFVAQAHFYSIFPSLVMLVVLAIILLTFAYLAAQFALSYIEFWVYLAFYPLILAIGVTTWTKQYAMNAILKPVSFGLRFMVLYFVVGVAMQVGQQLQTLVSSIALTNMTALWSIAGGCIVLLLLAMKAPQMASDLLSNSLSLSAGDGVGGAMVAGGALAVAGGGAMGTMKAAGVGASSLAAATNVASAGVNAARMAGATGVMGTAMGAGAAIGKGVADTVKESIQGLGSSTAPGRLAARINEAATGTISAGGSSPDSAMRPTPPAPSAASVMPAASSSIQSTMQQIQQLDSAGSSQPDAPIPPEEGNA